MYICVYIYIFLFIYITIFDKLISYIFFVKTNSNMKNSPTIVSLAQNRISALSCSQAAYLYHAVFDVRAICFELSFVQSRRF